MQHLHQRHRPPAWSTAARTWPSSTLTTRGWGTPAISGWLVAGTPGPPKNLTVSKGSGSINASWSPAASSGAPIDVYGVFAYDASGYTGLYASACGTCTTATVAGLTSGKMYTIVVYAYNAFGWGAPVSSAPVVPA